jgi:AraC family transcriptional regulator
VSKFMGSLHFHRLFTAIMGETINDYISRRRLERAVGSLICDIDISMTQIALDNGFSSSANFSKAVKLYFGFSPSAIRNLKKTKTGKIGKIYSKYGKVFSPEELYPTRINNNVAHTAYLDRLNAVVAVKAMNRQRVCTLASQRGYEQDAIFKAWDQIIGWAVNNGIKQCEQNRFSFAFDNPTITPANKCRYDAAIVIDDNINVNSPFIASEIPKGKYAVLYFKGPPEEAINAQLSIYSDWLPNSGFEPDDFPMLENYLNDARIDGHLEMNIYVKLKEV